MEFTLEALRIDATAEVDRIITALCYQVQKVLLRQGAVVGINGSLDSSVVLALAVHAFGPGRVVPVVTIEEDSNMSSASLAELVAQHFGVVAVREAIADVLEAFGCGRRRDEAVQRVYPPFDSASGYTVKTPTEPHALQFDGPHSISVTIVGPDGEEVTRRLPPRESLQVVSASNFRHRARMSVHYYHAERNNYAVVGAVHRSSHHPGLFVKYGDYGVDVNPIGHLYRTQVHQLAGCLDIPAEIMQRQARQPFEGDGSPDLPAYLASHAHDLLLFAHEQGVPADDAARVVGLSVDEIEQAYRGLAKARRHVQDARMTPIGLDTRTRKPARTSLTSRSPARSS